MYENYLQSITRQLNYYKSLGDKTFEQLTEEELFWQYNNESNSIAILVKHMVGNMLSRWTNFLTEDGEKSWRNRDDEFVNSYTTKEELITNWEKGWHCVFDAIYLINKENINQLVYIRNQGHTIVEAINRQLCHYSYHVGQLVFLGKMIKNTDWNSLSIPKNESKNYNKEKFSNKKTQQHFTDDL